MRHINNLAAIGTAWLIAGAGAAAQTDVPRGGADIPVGAGSGQAVLSVKNKTGKAATDVTVSIFNTLGHQVPNITGVDIVQSKNDHVDDNGDGDTDGDANENDTVDATPGKTAKSILSTGTINNNGTVDVTVNLSADLPAGTSFRVKFSTEIGDTHYDMCSVVPIDPFGGAGNALLALGSPQGAPGVLTDPGFAIGNMLLLVDPINPLIGVVLPEPYQDSLIDLFPDGAMIFLEPPIPGGELVEVGLTFAEPIVVESPIFVQAETFPYEPPPACLGDFNSDGELNVLDFVDFQGAWTLQDPYADVNGDGLYNILDFVDFQQAFQEGCPTYSVLVDDAFDEFELGPVCGQGGWEPWYANPQGCAMVTDEESFTLPHSVKMVGDTEDPLGDDAVRIVAGANEGVWAFSMRTFVPADAGGLGWLTFLNTYSAGGSKNWSLALAFDASLGMILEDPLHDPDPPMLPLIYDQWVLVEVFIDLDADVCSVFYDGQLLLAGQSWSEGMGAPGQAAIEALHLDAGDPPGGISAMYIDDVRLETLVN